MINKVNSRFIVVKSYFYGFKNYSYIVFSDQNECAVIDPAWNMNTFVEILSEHDVNKVMVLLTHSHIDHINLVDKFITEYQAEVYISKEEAEYYKFHKKNLHLVTDESRIQFGTKEIECILTPGHTIGSMCYQLDNIIFTGDTLFIEGCGTCFGPGGDATMMYNTIQKLKYRLHDEVVVYPGHCYGKEVGVTMKVLLTENLYLQIEDIEKFVKFRNRKNQSGIFGFL